MSLPTAVDFYEGSRLGMVELQRGREDRNCEKNESSRLGMVELQLVLECLNAIISRTGSRLGMVELQPPMLSNTPSS